MKSLIFQSAFVALSLAANEGNVKSLEEVFGPVDEVKLMSPKIPRTRSAADLNAYKAARLPEDCIFPLDIVIVQDSTDSFTDDYAHMKGTQLPLMVSTLKETHPGSTFGLITFRDKPITPFGIPPTAENGFYSDYCARIDVPLSDIEALLPLAYANNPPNGGGDPAENQFHAMLGAVQSQGIAWPSGVDRAKLLVLVTDAPPHFGSDGSSMQNMTTFGGILTRLTLMASV